MASLNIIYFMRLYGIPSEDRAEEIANNIKEGEWVFVDRQENKKEFLSAEEAREKFKELINQVRSWKEQMSTLSKYAIFIFVDDTQNPKAIKVYDTSSLGCSTSLVPERWRLYRKEMEGEFNDN
ncbi:putative protein [Aquifex aeolicus VF5]|uniref:Uncharacterized protein aq_2134 n=2 Tax=Aquifex aeolicus TaxID=63363 RepID=Y2134_AQUAE|nr:RecName: Full=Uncharacterized protein aq_2134 [Aquifex aeolicus VF5]AAC07857.1 putative protein [Aquifex aeolicus VF5]